MVKRTKAGGAAAKPGRAPLPDQVDDPASDGRVPIVGIGASAGGLAAFEAFFSGMPADMPPGMAFVLVQHLAPAHPSILPEILRRFTELPVHEAADGMVVTVDHVYVIPPRWHVEVRAGRLRLLEPLAARGRRLPIDVLFRSMAQDRGPAAMAVVLSGTGTDGMQGAQAIRAAGGFVLVQSPDTAGFDGMPRAAMDTAEADQALAPIDMPARLVAHVAAARGGSPPLTEPLPAADADALGKIFAQLLIRTGHDFSHYKFSTVQRRLQRRMAVNQIDGLEGYAAYVQQSTDEAQALFRDLLIGVTQFFRDPEAFRVLEQDVVPALLARRVRGQPLRVWVPGCSSGEEAYSIAMLLLEQLDEPATPQVLQLFATDIDERAVALARAGVYPAAIAGDLAADRLQRHFVPEPGGNAYRVRKQLRDLIVISEHDLTRDPPFSRLDLMSCRNLLIYLDNTLQQRMIPLFHYALKPGGMLFLGSSESIGNFERLFEPTDRRAKLFQRLDQAQGRPRAVLDHLLGPAESARTPHPAAHSLSVKPPRPSLRTLAEAAILQQLPVAAALVDAQGDIFYLHGRTGLYLEPTPGDVGTPNIVAMAREGLRRDLSLALAQAAALGKPTSMRGVRVKTNGHHTGVDMGVSAVATDSGVHAPPLYLVLLQSVAAAAPLPSAASEADANAEANADANANAGADADGRIAVLNELLRVRDDQLQSLHEELESSVEELKSSNEEMQSVNEELQSANEELETSKEELQSVNEELSTVNAELENKVADLSRANDDMNNLLAGTGIATVFVDHGLRILRFTPSASEIINLIASDIGRPVGHLASNLDGYDSLVKDSQAVLDTLIPTAQDVRTRGGRWYAMRIQPYRTIQNVIEGAVITFVDISDSVRTRVALRKVNELLRLAVVVRDAFDAVTVHDLDGRTLAWNPAATALYGWSEAEALAINLRDRMPAALRAEALTGLRQAAEAAAQDAQKTQRLDKAGRLIDVWVKATALQNEDAQVYAIATTERERPA